MNRSARNWLLITGVALISIWVLIPIYLLAASSLSGRLGVTAWPKTIFPAAPTLEVLQFFFRVDGVWKATWVSIQVAVMTMVFSIALGAPAGYALARYAFAGKDMYRLVILLTRAFPVAILALPLTVRFIQLGVYDTPLGIALVHTCLALPFAVLVTSSLFVGIPKELEEAAWTMGCTGLQAFFKVVLPIALPGLAATAIFAFVISWNEVFAAAVLSVQNRTLTAYLLSVLSESPLHFRFAGGLFLIIPAVLFIFAVRKYLFSMWGIANR
jgi:multiple sugar transport system permease protein